MDKRAPASAILEHRAGTKDDYAEINETNVAPHTAATFVTSAEGRLLNQAFDKIDDLAVHKKISAMVVSLADGEPNPSE